MSQIKRLQEETELLHEPAPGSTDGSYQPGNNVYKLKKIDADTVVLYQSGIFDGRPYYSSRGFKTEDLLNGQWAFKEA